MLEILGRAQDLLVDAPVVANRIIRVIDDVKNHNLDASEVHERLFQDDCLSNQDEIEPRTALWDKARQIQYDLLTVVASSR